MLHSIDNYLIDRIFQPISDFFSRWISCYGIAAFILTGAVVMRIVLEVVVDGAFAKVFEAIIATAIYLECGRAYILDSKPPSDILPAYRITHYAVRVFAIFSFPPFSLFLLFDIFFPDAVQLLIDGSWMSYMVAVFFLSCRKRPPRPQEYRTPAFALGATPT